MKNYLAHSAKGEYPAQTYEDHIRGVLKRSLHYALEAQRFCASKDDCLINEAAHTSAYHDLGKLLEENQKALQSGHHLRLPINHVDAGSAALLRSGDPFAALAVYSHHVGLPNGVTENNRRQNKLRDAEDEVRKKVDENLPNLMRVQDKLLPEGTKFTSCRYLGDKSVFYRMLLSCLVDADHSDTAAVYGRGVQESQLLLQPEQRLQALDLYVAALPKDGERNRLRQEMYQVCRDSETADKFTVCDSPVGSGKTLAIMAHLLKQAAKRGARRIFVVLPYTSIIRQSVEVYRKALVLPGEDPEKVVAEHHCRADYNGEDARYLTALWRAPIVVTTSVAFFETLASNGPSGLRRYHELPGSMIFVDEAHNALPVKLLPLAWRWMNCLAEEWGCYWVLASGSLVRFWQLSALEKCALPQPVVHELVRDDLRERLSYYESGRISYCFKNTPLSRRELIDLVLSAPGPRLVILNTVQNAAVIANDLVRISGRTAVEHLSTALTPEDRAHTIERIYSRLNEKSDDDWTLVATSCVEAGVDFSFRTGFREMASLLSLLQASGRVNRHGEEPEAQMWSFRFQDDSMLRKNHAMDDSRKVLKGYFQNGVPITPALSTKSVNDEISADDSGIKQIKQLLKMEQAMQFQDIASEFHVIESDSVLAVPDEVLAKEILQGKSDWQTLQRKAVAIRRKRAKEMNLRELVPDIFQWTYGYDSFLGYMRGVLEKEN